MVMRMTENSVSYRILYVEDNEHDRIAFTRTLNRSEIDCSIHHCSRGEEALHIWQNSPQPFDLLVTDYKLPGIKGLDLSKKILNSSQPIPVIMLTGEGNEELAVQALKSGIQDYLIKDQSQGYLQLLPVIIPQVIENSQEHAKRVEVEEALRKSESRYRGLFENISQAFFLIQLLFDAEHQPIDAMYLESNEQNNLMLAGKNESVVGKRMSAFNSREDTVAFLKRFALPALEGESINTEYYWAEFERYYNIICYSPAPGMVAFLAEDIQQRKEAEEQIRKSEEKYRLLANTISDVICQIDHQGNFTYFSPSVLQVAGFSEEELIGEHFSMLVHQDDQQMVTDISLKNFNGEATTVEWRCKVKDGSYIWMETNATPQVDKQGKVTQIVASSRDITARKESEEKVRIINEELRLSNASKDKFFSILAHDLMNPFQVLSGLASVLVKKFDRLDVASIKKYISNIAETADHTHRLVENLLLWSRAQSGRLQTNKEFFDLGTIIRNVTQLLQSNMKEKDISLLNTVINDIEIYADKNMMNTVVRNILGNAVKFTHRGGNITIDAAREGDFCILSIKDDGIGIDEEVLDNLFRIDTSVSKKGTEGEEGTGLGLILCKEFVTKNNGDITVSSEKGKGSTFILTLPVKDKVSSQQVN